jgi:exopolysaccharide production protein ExoY
MLMSGRPELRLTRALDLLLASIALAFFAPLLVLIAVMVKLEDGGPVFFAHRRLGRNGHQFGCLKFRSMRIDAQQRLQALLSADRDLASEWAETHKLQRDPRVTRIGGFLRRSSLDELPQLINVLMGDMAIVGPRPIIEAEVARYGPLFSQYCRVPPGITGLWQISGRSDLNYRQRVALDAEYVGKKCVATDLAILVKTIPVVLYREGAY